ncbi:MAG: hypothetical protein LLF97_10290 [Planctomycetaceae bacterium]|nr:hypothetical protein [Planctomycetaceae bacterium]
MSMEPAVLIRFDSDASVYQPGDVLAGHYVVERFEADPIRSVEVSVLWHTQGKGDEDMAVHEFWSRNAADLCPIDLRHPEQFVTKLPNSPLSYEGRLIKLHWCVRVRVFLQNGKELFGERKFQLGSVPSLKRLAAE